MYLEKCLEWCRCCFKPVPPDDDGQFTAQGLPAMIFTDEDNVQYIYEYENGKYSTVPPAQQTRNRSVDTPTSDGDLSEPPSPQFSPIDVDPNVTPFFPITTSPLPPFLNSPRLHANSPPKEFLFSPMIPRVPSLSDPDCSMPEMLPPFSKVLSGTQISGLFLALPRKYRICPWKLLYSAEVHGYSLHSLYQKLLPYEDCSVLLLIKDQPHPDNKCGTSTVATDDSSASFGALLPPPNCRMRGERYLGTGETCVFTFYPVLSIYKASGANDCYFQGMPHYFSLGGYPPSTALYVDSEFLKGSSSYCNTFHSPPLAKSEEFLISQFECWAVTDVRLEGDSESDGSCYGDFLKKRLVSAPEEYLPEPSFSLCRNDLKMSRSVPATRSILKTMGISYKGRSKWAAAMSKEASTPEKDENGNNNLQDKQCFSELTSVMMMDPAWCSRNSPP